MSILGRPPTVRASRRDPSNDLYDRACDLVVAAEEIRAAAAQPGSAAAIAATVGCLEASLEALADAAAGMRREAARQLARSDPSGGRDAGIDASPALADREFSELVDALRAAHLAADAMRERVGPLLAELTLV
jgi:hypothetical protein